MKKIITRIKGGLGNQLFCYAAARRLALANNAELVIDDVTGFSRDVQYLRNYMLDKFCIEARKATPKERMEPLERYRRGLEKYISRRKPFQQRRYLEQEGNDFDARLLDLKVAETVYLDGYWQSEEYFKDVKTTIREDLRITPPEDTINQRMAEQIRQSNAIAVHVRWFDTLGSEKSPQNLLGIYYRRAIAEIEKNVKKPHYFFFSDDTISAKSLVTIPNERRTFVDQNRGDENAHLDLWLMAHCKHFIIANSTFSWWGAWLGEGDSTIVIAPGITGTGVAAWGFQGLIPERWIIL